MTTAQSYAKKLVDNIKKKYLKVKKNEIPQREISKARSQYLYFCYLHSPEGLGKNYFQQEVIKQLYGKTYKRTNQIFNFSR